MLQVTMVMPAHQWLTLYFLERRIQRNVALMWTLRAVPSRPGWPWRLQAWPGRTGPSSGPSLRWAAEDGAFMLHSAGECENVLLTPCVLWVPLSWPVWLCRMTHWMKYVTDWKNVPQIWCAMTILKRPTISSRPMSCPRSGFVLYPQVVTLLNMTSLWRRTCGGFGFREDLMLKLSHSCLSETWGCLVIHREGTRLSLMSPSSLLCSLWRTSTWPVSRDAPDAETFKLTFCYLRFL